MGPLVFLACLCGEVALPLGVAIQESPGGAIRYFERPYLSESPLESVVLWRFLAQHGGHRIKPLYDFAAEWNELNANLDPRILGGDADRDISFEDYVANQPESRDNQGAERRAVFIGDGYLSCTQCRERLWLGRSLTRGDDHVRYFHAGGAEDPPNSRSRLLNRALWRFLTMHPMHELVVRVLRDASTSTDYVTIGGTRPGDRGLADFVGDWVG
ncbi:hypothetical protein O1Q96_16310 [Streptomyces sp. Qhu-G9]|uniref:hypothetical protein n=1 Tax=Streptomyces sp. Qhu-G9 TaxID=3452799 RepID=UPI0022ABF9B1|nr:hypothetical protein [Streptomyces aurantiacus]WAU81200.1 hypothetical protein O1Q96_16310 [Streptomyces aurantiacus]